MTANNNINNNNNKVINNNINNKRNGRDMLVGLPISQLNINNDY